MIIYVPASIRAGRGLVDTYRHIVEFLESRGHTVPNKHIGGDAIEEREASLTPQEIHDEDKQGVEKADLVIAEVSQPSLGVGMEIGYAVMMGKPTYAIYAKEREATMSMMIMGNDKLKRHAYNDITELGAVLEIILTEQG